MPSFLVVLTTHPPPHPAPLKTLEQLLAMTQQNSSSPSSSSEDDGGGGSGDDARGGRKNALLTPRPVSSGQRCQLPPRSARAGGGAPAPSGSRPRRSAR